MRQPHINKSKLTWWQARTLEDGSIVFRCKRCDGIECAKSGEDLPFTRAVRRFRSAHVNCIGPESSLTFEEVMAMREMVEPREGKLR